MKKLTSRRIHRYLSILIGFQLLFWTLSGLIFSWNPIRKVRGEHLVQSPMNRDLAAFELASLEQIRKLHPKEFDQHAVVRMETRMMLDRPVMEIWVQGNEEPFPILFDARDGSRLSPIDEATAKQIALSDFSESASVTKIERLTESGSHSEYRGKELPAYRIQLDHETQTAIYVSENRGVVTTRRNRRWRIFDFFWMLHTMDYQGRDNFNSLTLRVFSIFGVATVFSGYWLWWRTSSMRRKWRRARRSPHRSSSNRTR